MQMSQELAAGACFPYYADPKLGHAGNDLYRALLESVESGIRFRLPG